MASTTAGRNLTRQHKLEQIRLGARFVAASRMLLGELNPAQLDGTVMGWLPLQVLLAEAFHRDSTNLAAAYLAEYRSAEAGRAGAQMPIVRSVFDAVTAADKTALLVPMAKKATGDGLDARTAVDQVFWSLVNDWRTGAMAGGRGLVDASTLANDHSSGWRRVTDADPCTWCAMLASRGPAYRSAETAGEGRYYHASCGCTAEEVFGDWVPTAEEQRFIDLYEASHEPGMSASETTAAMRENGQGIVNDATKPKTQTAGAGGGGGRRRPPAGFGEPPDPANKEAWRDYWQRRQDALPVDFHGDQLKSHEVEFVERFLARGNDMEWIAKSASHPTSDLLWLNMGRIPVEVKSTKARWETIRPRITDAVKRAKQHKVAKQYFIVDLGAQELTQGLREQIAGYNSERTRYTIRRLWIMSEDGGQFEEIILNN